MLHKLYSFAVPVADLVEIYILYIRSILENSAVVWHSALTIGQELELERVQKVALRIILKDKYVTYGTALKLCSLQTLKDRRRQLCLTFASPLLENVLRVEKTTTYFREENMSGIQETQKNLLLLMQELIGLSTVLFLICKGC